MHSENDTDAPKSATLPTEVIEALRRGECPDGGGPQCSCKCLGKIGQCVALAEVPKCTTCDDDGLFRIGMFTDVCGNCIGTKHLDGDVIEAVLEGRDYAAGRKAFADGAAASPPSHMKGTPSAEAWSSGFSAARGEA